MITKLSFCYNGRYGNNIIAIINALYVHENTPESYLVIPSRGKILSKVIDFHQIYSVVKDNLRDIFLNEDRSIKEVNLGRIYWWKKQTLLQGLARVSFEKRLDYNSLICNKILDLKDVSDTTIPKEDLLIHVRAGDIYKTKAHRSYAQPPISFYEKTIVENRFNNIHILSEDSGSFVGNQLISIFGQNRVNIIQEPCYKKAFNIIRCAKNICTSTSSFCTTAILLKPDCLLEKNIFTYEYVCYQEGFWRFGDLFDDTLKRSGYNFSIYSFKNYPFMVKNNNQFNISNWSYDENTKKIMINHSTNDIIKLGNHEFR
jgi:hypothetical protein